MGKYLLREPLGVGGMACVFRVLRSDDGQVFALKLIHEHLRKNREFRQRFQREIDICKRLDHPNIVKLSDVGEVDPKLPENSKLVHAKLYMVMEFVDGYCLDELIPEGGLPLPTILRWLFPVLDGLLYAHDQGLIHRDVTAGNIMITKTGVPKILDFGLALADGMSRFTQIGDAMGHPPYMAPEQFGPATPDARTDQYSLGIVIYQMLTGHCPFAGTEGMALAVRHIRDNPAPLRQVRNDIPELLDALFLRMLKKKPAERFSDLRQFRTELLAITQ